MDRKRDGRGGWLMRMRWEDVLFLHWAVEAEAMRRCVPAEMEVDTFEDKAWLGVVPFLMSGVRGRCLPGVPGAQRFCELNVRTYVTVGGVAGVYFFSLDAASRLAVRVARLTFGLPYFDASMRYEKGSDRWVRYESERTHRGAAAARFAGRYRGTGQRVASEAGTLGHFLTERYALYTAKGGRVRRGDVAHGRWPLERAEAEIDRCEMTGALGIDVPADKAVAYYAGRVEVVAWWPIQV